MSQVSRSKAIQLAQSLPPRLQYFLKKWPTPTILETTNQPPPAPIAPATPIVDLHSSEPNDTITSAPIASLPISPFDAYKDPTTGKWHPPFYSLRRQADLVKLARRHGVEELMPYSVKGSIEKQRRREEHGLRVKGTGIGQKVKGKEWERTLKGRLEKRRQAMLEMPQMIQTWKERGHGRGWKKWPK